MEYNFHTHTYRCNHAIGEDEEYVQKAIKAGLKRLGFSDHIFLPGIYQKTSRGAFMLYEDYLDSIKALKDKYKDEIEISIGLEAEYSDRFLPFIKEQLETKKVEYLILGQHFNFDKGDNPPYIRDQRNDIDALKTYVEQVKKGLKTGLFSYLAHPDLYVVAFDEWNEECINAAHEICKICEELDIPMEINAHAHNCWDTKRKMVYPYPEFWEIASQYNIDVVIGYDAHDPKEFRGKLEYEYNLIKKYNLHLLDDYRI